MKKQAISKKVINVALVLIMLFALVPTMAVNAASVPRMQSSIMTSVHSEALFFQGVDATGAYILHSNGELWAYIAGSPNDPSRVLSSRVMTDVIAVTSSVAFNSSQFFFSQLFRETQELYVPGLVGLSLRSDGTVWLIAVGVRYNTNEMYIRSVQIDSGVSKISGNYYLKEDGNLYAVSFSRRDNTQRTIDFSGINAYLNRISSNIIDTVNGVHLPSNRILEVSGTRIEEVQAIFSNPFASFALASNGRLYGWGNNNLTGSVGIGATFDSAFRNFSGFWQLIVERPRYVMSNVATVYFDENIVFARDTSGRLWQWGDAEPARVANSRVETWGAVERLRPRLSTHIQPTLNSINGVTVLSDGSLLVPINHNNVSLPVSLSSIMGSGGVSMPPSQPTTPQPPTTEPPSSWAIPQVNAAIAAGLVPQNLQSRYTQATTRAEFAALAVALYETVTGREITGRMQFNDTNDINVQKMGYLGVVTGVGGGNFATNNSLTREQAAVMLARLADVIGQPIQPSAPTFADNNQISSWAVDAVGQMQATGIMGGVGNNNFAPNGDYTREQSIITILRLFELLQ